LKNIKIKKTPAGHARVGRLAPLGLLACRPCLAKHPQLGWLHVWAALGLPALLGWAAPRTGPLGLLATHARALERAFLACASAAALTPQAPRARGAQPPLAVPLRTTARWHQLLGRAGVCAAWLAHRHPELLCARCSVRIPVRMNRQEEKEELKDAKVRIQITPSNLHESERIFNRRSETTIPNRSSKNLTKISSIHRKLWIQPKPYQEHGFREDFKIQPDSQGI